MRTLRGEETTHMNSRIVIRLAVISVPLSSGPSIFISPQVADNFIWYMFLFYFILLSTDI